MRRRIEKAKEVLTYDRVPITEVAVRSGFRSVHHVNRVCKEHEGVPPGSYRERERSGVWKNVASSRGLVNEDRTLTKKEISNTLPVDDETR